MAQRASSHVANTSTPRYTKKLFYRIQEVSKITDLKAYVLRYWESQFSELAPEKGKNDQRRYRQADIDMILKIKDLLYNQKFTIAGARQFIRSERSKRGSKVSDSVRWTALKGIRSELHELMSSLSA